MNLNDFFFSYKTIFKSNILKKNYFKALRKLFNFPYKFLLFRLKILLKKDKIKLEKLERFNNQTLDDLFINFNSDKGSKVKVLDQYQPGHNYSHSYEKYFSKFKKNENVNILEIGSLFGSSAASFYNYFESVNICCLDINPFNMKYISEEIRMIYIDTQSKVIINDLANYIKNDFDIIIDDGSHNKKDQILTLNSFFPKLKKNGIYVIEDTYQYLDIPELNDDKLDYGINEFLKEVNKTGYHRSLYLDDNEKKKLQANIKKIFYEKGNFVYKNESLCEIIFIEKN